MERNEIIILSLLAVVIVSIAGYMTYSKVVKPKTVTGNYTVKYDYRGMEEDGDAKGYLIFNIVVNNQDKIKFDLNENTFPYELESPELPDGAELRANDTVSMIFNPMETLLSGTVKKRGFAYDDHGQEEGGGKHRVYQYYILGDDWKATHVPFEVQFKKNGSTVFGPKTYVSSDMSKWGITGSVDLPYNITMRNVGQLAQNMAIPQKRYAFYTVRYQDGGLATRICKLSDFERRLKQGYEGTRTVLETRDWIDKWGEVTDGADLNGWGSSEWEPTISELNNSPYYGEFFEEVPEGVIPESVTRIKPRNAYYSETVPHDISESWFGKTLASESFYKKDSKYTVVRAIGNKVSAQIQVKVPMSVFDSWVYVPPSGDPNIVDVTPPKLYEGQTGKVTVRVKNEGYSGDVFSGTLDLPYDYMTVTDSPSVYIPKGESRLLQWYVSVGSSSRTGTYSGDGTVTVKAEGSGKTTSSNVSFTMEPDGGNGGEGQGAVIGKVVNPKGNPIQGAEVYVGSKFDVTGSNGTFEVAGVNAGSHTLRVVKNNYETRKMDVFVETDKRKDVGRIELEKAGEEEGLPWLWIVGGIVMAVAVIMLIYAYRQEVIGR